MGIHDAIMNELAKSKNSNIPNNNNKITKIDEWIKWLEYNPSHILEEIEQINAKKPIDLTIDELTLLSSFIRNKRMADLLNKYINNELKMDESKKVEEYIDHESIEILMCSKLTTNEMLIANQRIEEMSKLPFEEIYKEIELKQQKDNYSNLSMIDSYVLHILTRIAYSRDMIKLNTNVHKRKNNKNTK